ncbi:putative MFS metabolite transporter [hydrothermal vent metagenome]|uniref:Putative MFS metabolite transporter n=1 Tax=hydrothermal vent metagenome TaxID=652676 RepID=A0A1W1D5G9_9ZZZZ
MSFLLGSFYFFYFGIIGIYIIFFPKVLDMVGYSSDKIGFILSVSPLVRFIIPFLFLKGFQLNKKYFYIALIVLVISSISFSFSLFSFYPLLLSNIGLGIGLSLILPYIEVIALDTIKKEAYGKVRLFGSIGFIIVALVLVRYLTSVQIAIYYLIFFVITTALFAFVIARKKQATSHTTLSNTINLLKDWSLWVGLTLMQISFGAYYNFFTIYETHLGMSLDMTINLWVFGVIIEIIMLFFQGKLLRYNLITILQFTTFSAVIRWLLLFLYPQNLPILFFAQSLHALNFALFYTAAISYLHQHYAHKVLAQQFFSGITFGFGGLIGAILFGYMYKFYPSFIFLGAALIALLGVFMLFYYAKKSKQTP